MPWQPKHWSTSWAEAVVSDEIYNPVSPLHCVHISLLLFFSSVCLPDDFSQCQLRPDICFYAASSRTDKKPDRGSNRERSEKSKKKIKLLKMLRRERREWRWEVLEKRWWTTGQMSGLNGGKQTRMQQPEWEQLRKEEIKRGREGSSFHSNL